MDGSARLRRLASLAHLALDDAELEALLPDLKDLLALFDELEAADVEGVSPLTHPLEGSCPLRDDDLREADLRGAYASPSSLLAGAPSSRGDPTPEYFVVPSSLRR